MGAEDGYSGVEVRVTPTRTEIIIMATRTQNVMGEKGRRIRELTSVVQKRFNFPEVQAHWRSRREACLLWCPQIYHGVWSQGLRGGRERKAEGPEGQVHEVCGWSHDPLWRPRQRLRRLCLQTRSPEAGCAWNQGQDHVAVRPHWQDWTQEASARQRVDRGAQGGDPAAQPLLRDQGCQARPGPRTCCLNSCLYTLISHFHVLSVNTERVLKA